MPSHKLRPCPWTPNCVSSCDRDKKHKVAPITYDIDEKAALTILKDAINMLDRVTITAQKSDYIHAECKSKVFGFVDDVEFYIDREAKVIHVRSASRLGFSDFGVNRKRIELIRKNFNYLKGRL
ncbi:protein of unknown function DUF1499 [Candidatus Magnetoovum chiemensis]|nr:protein of unknown function DUF1499 [Candidatus Magnetoovum chiemensis]